MEDGGARDKGLLSEVFVSEVLANLSAAGEHNVVVGAVGGGGGGGGVTAARDGVEGGSSASGSSRW